MTESNEKIIALKIEPSRIVKKVELPPAKYKFQRMQMAVSNDCRAIDIKDTYNGLGLEQYCLVFDDEFLINGRAKLNPIGSYLYGYQKHGQPLCGNVLIMKNFINADEELETVGLSDEDVNIIKNFIDENIEEIFDVANEFADNIIIQRMLNMALSL